MISCRAGMYFNIKNTHNRHQQGYEIYKEKDKSAPNQEANHKKTQQIVG